MSEPLPGRGFASDNNAGAHPQVLAAIANANHGHCTAYGDDPFTQKATAKFQRLFGDDIQVFLVFGGTGANVLALKALTDSHNAVICADTAHIHVDECGASEKFTGCKLLPIHTADGKLTTAGLMPLLADLGDPHRNQPAVLSVTQATELGTVYSPEELAALADFAHQHGLRVHMDGARFANAIAHLDIAPRAATREVGVDVLTFGGTKNGMLYGEAVIFFDAALARNFSFLRKQGMQLASKMRFISAQFDALLSDELWLESGKHANQMARLLAAELEGIPAIQLTRRVEANAVFAHVPRELVPSLQSRYPFYVWNESRSEVRWMTSFDTTEQDVQEFIAFVNHVVDAHTDDGAM